jgi:murein DD-endopeptidase MepM/ murein hydrolase activator NlpD
VAVGVALCVAWGWGEAAHGEAAARETIFERLGGAQSRAEGARERAERLSERGARARDHAEQVREQLELAERATRALRDEAARQQVAWAIASRRAARAGAPREVDALLAHATPRVMSARRDDYLLVAKVRSQRDLLGEEVTRAAAAALARATSLAVARASDVRGQRMREEARGASGRRVEQDLAVTSAALGEAIEGMRALQTREDFHRHKGTLIPAVTRAPLHRFGARGVKGYVRTTGYTYDIEEGREVKATSRGLVVFAGSQTGYGRTVVVDHGSGYHSVYAHLSAAKVRAGQRVSRGDVLGESGSTGSLSGPRLYFELRKGGEPIDPAPWFVRR